MKQRPLVSVIITTKDSAATITACLESIRGQDYPPECLEVIVVDNNSSDQTKQIAQKFTGHIFIQGPERSRQRNYGAEKAQGEYILYLDSDMSLSEGVISECVAKCQKDGCAALYIPEKVVGSGFWIKVRDFERSFYNATVIDCVRFLRRDTFLLVKGFDENLTGPEDWDFDRRIRQNGSVDIIKSVLYHHEEHFALGNYLKKKAYYGQSLRPYAQKWGIRDSTTNKQIGFAYRFWGVFVENGKWKRLLRHPFLSLGMYSLRIAVGFTYLLRGKN